MFPVKKKSFDICVGIAECEEQVEPWKCSRCLRMQISASDKDTGHNRWSALVARTLPNYLRFAVLLAHQHQIRTGRFATGSAQHANGRLVSAVRKHNFAEMNSFRSLSQQKSCHTCCVKRWQWNAEANIRADVAVLCGRNVRASDQRNNCRVFQGGQFRSDRVYSALLRHSDQRKIEKSSNGSFSIFEIIFENIMLCLLPFSMTSGKFSVNSTKLSRRKYYRSLWMTSELAKMFCFQTQWVW